MSDDYNSRQRCMYSKDDKERQKEELAKKYEQRRAPLEKEQAKLQTRLNREREELRQARDRHDHDPRAVSQNELSRRESDIQKLETKAADNQTKLTELNRRQQLGNECIDSATVTQGPTGDITINAKLGPPQPRLNYEHENRSGLEPRKDAQRAHSSGPGTGFESDCGINHGPDDVNQELQNRGVEQRIRDTYGQKKDGCELWMKTVSSTHEGTRDLKEIQYEISARPEGSQAKPEVIYRHTITVDKNGKAQASKDEWAVAKKPGDEGWSPYAESYLKQLPPRTDSTTMRAEKPSCHQATAGKEICQKSPEAGAARRESSPKKRYDYGRTIQEQRASTNKSLGTSTTEKHSTTPNNSHRVR